MSYKEKFGKRDNSYLIGNKFRQGKKPSNAFEKGHIPWNKGVKGIHLSPESEFQKGEKPITWQPVGTISERTQKRTNKTRQFIKIAEPNKWELYAVYLLKKAGVNIPKGSVVHHINKNCLDDRLENLVVLTRAEHIEIHRQDLLEAKKAKEKSL